MYTPRSHSSFTHENTRENIAPPREVQTATKPSRKEEKRSKLLPRRFSEFEKELEEAINEPLNLTFDDVKDAVEELDEINAVESDEAKLSLSVIEEEKQDAETKLVNSQRFAVPFTPLKNNSSTPYKILNTQHGSAFKSTFENKENKVQAVVPLISSAKKSKVISSIFSTPKINANKASVKNPLREVTLNNNKTLTVKGVTYVVLKELGKGGSSVVYDCYEPVSGVNRAVKDVSIQQSSTGFIREVELLKKLQNCPSIITMYDYEIVEAKQQLLVVLEKGTTDLAKILRENTKLPFHKITYFWMEMLYAVQQIHNHGIVHCDLKPSNFVMNHEGSIKLIDFGISCSIQNDMTSAIKTDCEGSLNYMSPEALSASKSCDPKSPSFGKPRYKVNFKSDVWSLGCILYQLVYKKTPFHQFSALFPKITAICDPNREIEYPDSENLPKKLINTIQKCLVRNYKNRSSIDELIKEYEIN